MTTDKILGVFETFRMSPTPIDEYEKLGKKILAEKIESFTVNNNPIEFVMLGLPFKSINIRDKVIGVMPDLGEELMIKNFADFNSKVKQEYEPGINVTIISDGFVFNDVLKVNDHIVEAYRDEAEQMGKGVISIYDLKDFYRKGLGLGELRERVVKEFGVTGEKLEQDILTNADVNYLYRGMIRFMSEEFQIYRFDSNSQLQKHAKRIAREMMFRNEAYSNLTRHEFSKYIRLSMHPSVNNGSKYSFQLIPGGMFSPWHSVIAKANDGSVTTMHRKDAEEQGYQLVYEQGKANHFSKN